jgi:hypothetical protein
VKFESGGVVGENGGDKSMPLLDLKMSQGYPCVKYEKDLASYKLKSTAKETKFFADSYSSGCPNTQIGEEYYTTANVTFREVENFPEVSEYTLLQ